jgi:hypothetical protein
MIVYRLKRFDLVVSRFRAVRSVLTFGGELLCVGAEKGGVIPASPTLVIVELIKYIQ